MSTTEPDPGDLNAIVRDLNAIVRDLIAREVTEQLRPIEPWVRQQIAQAISAHVDGTEHLAEQRVRDIVRDMLGGGPVPVPSFRRLTDDEVLFQLDPSRPQQTVGLDRDNDVQIWADSNVFNPRNPLDIVHAHLPPEQRTGYGLQMRPDGTVVAHPMSDGTTVRNGVIDRDGRLWYRIAHEFRLEDGYDAAGNVRFSGGRLVQSGGWRINRLTKRGAGHGSPVTFDGTRGGVHGAAYRMRADTPLVWGIEFDTHRRFNSTTNLAGPFDLHEPGSKLTGPFLCNIERGELVFSARTSKTAAALDYEATTQSDIPGQTLYRYRLPESGTVKLVARTVVDGTGRRSLFELFEVGPGGLPFRLHSTTERYGYTFAGPENERFYPIVQLYQWHEHNRPGSGRLPLWNHDPSFGDVNRLDVACFAVSDRVSVERMAEHVASFNPAAYALAA